MTTLQIHNSSNPGPRDKSKPSDSQLVDDIVKNSCQESFRTLCSRYIDGIYRLVASRINSPHDAEDLVQEIFLAMFHALPKFRQEAQFSTWFYRIAQNQVSQYFRRRFHNPAQRDLSEVEDMLDSSQSPPSLLSQDEEMTRLRHAILELPDIYRKAFLLRVSEGFSYREIAEILDCAPGTVDSRISRARSILATKLGSQP